MCLIRNDVEKKNICCEKNKAFLCDRAFRFRTLNWRNTIKIINDYYILCVIFSAEGEPHHAIMHIISSNKYKLSSNQELKPEHKAKDVTIICNE